MTARQRKEHETFSAYRANLREEARVERVKRKDKFVWLSHMVQITPEKDLKITKVPPYVRPENRKPK